MNANELLHYLRGFVDLSNEHPTERQWGIIRAAVQDARPVDTVVVDYPPMHNPTAGPPPKCGGCSGVKRM